MNEEEMEDLNQWVRVNVMGRSATDIFFRPCHESQYAMDVLKKCAEKHDCPIIRYLGKWNIGARHFVASDESLEVAICLLAKELFSK